MSAALGIHVRPYVDHASGDVRGGYLLVIQRSDAERQHHQGQWDALYRRKIDVGYAPAHPDWQDTNDLVNSCANLIGQGIVPACDWIVSISLKRAACPADV